MDRTQGYSALTLPRFSAAFGILATSVSVMPSPLTASQFPFQALSDPFFNVCVPHPPGCLVRALSLGDRVSFSGFLHPMYTDPQVFYPKCRSVCISCRWSSAAGISQVFPRLTMSQVWSSFSQPSSCLCCFSRPSPCLRPGGLPPSLPSPLCLRLWLVAVPHLTPGFASSPSRPRCLRPRRTLPCSPPCTPGAPALSSFRASSVASLIFFRLTQDSH